ncbi:MAG TPA: hypothetical protein VMS93_08940 [Candidatus Saccharimonadales bacterium]|nr:hypothetical protein [Candidatus Saccharimonadales bacterium]
MVYSARDSSLGSAILWTVRLDGTQAHSLRTRGESCRWNPQGSRVAFIDFTKVPIHAYVMDSSGRDLLDLGPTRVGSPSWNPEAGSPSWSPDGRRLLIQGLLYDAGTGESLGAPPLRPQVFEGDSVYPASPGGWVWDDRHVVVQGYEHLPDSRNHCVLHYDYYVTHIPSGAIVKRLTRARYTCEDSVLAVSPDGRRILIRLGAGAKPAALGVLDVATQQLMAVTGGPNDWSARWGSDSRSIVFLRMMAAPNVHVTDVLFYTSLDSLGHERRIIDPNSEVKGFDVHLDSRHGW